MNSLHRIVFVGESPPPSAPPDFRPFDCDSGTRLARLLGLRSRDVLLAKVIRKNLFDEPTGVAGAPPWAPITAAALADCITRDTSPAWTLVLLGKRVAEAFALPWQTQPLYVPYPKANTTGLPHTPHFPHRIVAPHPSGASTVLNPPEARREFRRALLVDLVLGTELTAADFGVLSRNEDRAWRGGKQGTEDRLASAQEVLADLAHVVAPTDPRTGAAIVRLHALAELRGQAWAGKIVPPPLVDVAREVTRLGPHAALFDQWANASNVGAVVSKREWGCATKRDIPGDDASRAVVPEPTYARACALRTRELLR